jgi:heme exporter protein C
MADVRRMPMERMPSAEAAPVVKATPTPMLLKLLTVVTIVLVIAGLYMALVYAGQDVDQGAVQRIFYIHVSAFAGAFVAFLATVVGGVAYLRTRNDKWDILALSGVEVGLALSLCNLVGGMVWARPIWNTWWTWDPRLTSALISVLTYAAYLMLRAGIENPDQRKRFASVYGILAFSTVVITLVIIRIRPDTIHPAVIGPSPQNAQGSFGLTPSMSAAFGFNMTVWSIFVPLVLVWYRIRLENFAQQVNALKARLLER